MPKSNDHPNEYEVADDDVGRRLDRVVRKFLPEHSLGTIFGAIRRGDIRVNSGRVDGSYRISPGDRISIPVRMAPKTPRAGGTDSSVLPNWFRDSIIFENENVLALDKPPGILVHGPSSLERAVEGYLRPGRRNSLSFTPGPLHRLDRNTSGLVLFGKSIAGATRFTALLRSRSVGKEYLALLEGRLDRTETWSDNLERDRTTRTSVPSSTGRAVRSVVSPLCSSDEATLAVVSMESGFTHQIRAQAAANGHALVADGKYGARDRGQRYLLHARSIRLNYFDSILGFRSLDAPLHPDQEARLIALFGAKALGRVLHRS